MIDTYVRPAIQEQLITPAAHILVRANINSNTLTLVALITGVAIIPALGYGLPWLAALLLITSGYCDILDGTVARLTDHDCPKGAVYDIVSDRIVEFSVIFGLYLLSPETRAAISLLMLGSVLICITSFLVVAIFSANEGEKSFHYSPGLMERTEAFTFFMMMIAFPKWFLPLGALFSIFVFYTAVVRIYEFSSSDNVLIKIKVRSDTENR